MIEEDGERGRGKCICVCSMDEIAKLNTVTNSDSLQL